MQRKQFKSRLFIKTSDLEYWQLPQAEILYRLEQVNDLNCPCSFCFSEKVKLEYLFHQIEEEGHITPNLKPNKFTGKDDCERCLGPIA